MKSNPEYRWVRTLSHYLNRRKIKFHSRYFDKSNKWILQWGWEENILGVCLGSKKRKPCLVFIVEHKIHPSRLTNKQFIPELLANKEWKSEIPTKIIECGNRFQLQQAYKGKVRLGLPIGHEHGYPSGTLGLLVRTKGSPPGFPSILSCGHVLGWSRKGMFPLPKKGDYIEQPVNLDSDPESLRIAKLTSNFTDLTRQNISDDYAIAELLPEISFQVLEGISISNKMAANEFPRNLEITMMGRVSGPAKGKILKMQGSVKLPAFGNVSFSSWTYHDVILYQVTNAAGDSGAAIIDTDTKQVVGLHIGGNGNIGLMYPVGPIFRSLNLELLSDFNMQ